MQLVVVMAVLGLVNIVGLGAVSEDDLKQRGVDAAEYHATIEVEEVPPAERANMMDAIQH